MFISALYVRHKILKVLQCLSTDEWVKIFAISWDTILEQKKYILSDPLSLCVIKEAREKENFQMTVHVAGSLN